MPGEEDWPVQLHEGWGAPAVLAVDEARIPGTKSLLFCCALRVSAGDEGQEDRVEGDAGGNRDLCRRWDGWIPVVLGVDASAAEQVLAVRTLLDTLQDALLSLGSAVPRAVLALDWAMVQRLKVRDRNSRDCVWCSADVDGRGRAQNGGPSISHASVVPCFEHGYAAVVRAVVVALLRSSTRAVGSLLPWLRTLRGVSAAMEYHPVHAGTGSGAESLAQSRVDGEQPAAGSLPPQSGVLMCRPSVRVSVNRNESRALAELLDSALGERPLSPALCSVPAAQRMRAAKVLRSLRRVVTALDRAGFSAPHATSDVERAGRHGGRLCRRLAALHHGTPSFRARSYTAELHNPLIHSVFAHVKRHVLTSGGNVNVASHRSFDGAHRACLAAPPLTTSPSHPHDRVRQPPCTALLLRHQQGRWPLDVNVKRRFPARAPMVEVRARPSHRAALRGSPPSRGWQDGASRGRQDARRRSRRLRFRRRGAVLSGS